MADTLEQKGVASNGQPGHSKPQKPSPLPEPSTVQWTRRWIIFAFWTIVICFGLPHWIRTTSTYRAALPLEQMDAWANAQTCKLNYPIRISLSVPGLDGAQPTLAHDIQAGLNARDGLANYEVFTGSADSTVNDTAALTVRLKADSEPNAHQRSSTLRPGVPVLDLEYGFSRPGGRDEVVTWAVEQIIGVFAAEETSLIYMLEDTPFATEVKTSPLDGAQKARLDAQSTRAFRYASTYHLTFSLFTPGSSPSAWDIERGFDDYIYPLVSALSGISTFTIDTQVQLHASFSPSIAGPQRNEASARWELQKSDLSGFINAAEWPLSPSIGEGPTINFVLYVPPEGESPLVIAETGGTSWLIPQWGGVAILNPSGQQAAKLTAQALEPVMLTFADQLSSLVGLPSAPDSLALRLSRLTRERTISLILSASSKMTRKIGTARPHRWPTYTVDLTLQ